MRRALTSEIADLLRRAKAVDAIAAGKAASAMLTAFAAETDVTVRTMLGVGPRGAAIETSLPGGAVWCDAGHPLPDAGSLEGARRALEIAANADEDDVLVVLLSGGGSALMALPAPGITLEAKQETARTLMAQSADIYELNTVRKHLSGIKGGRLAAASRGGGDARGIRRRRRRSLVIASGPTVADESTFADALRVLLTRGGVSLLSAGGGVLHPARRRRGDAGVAQRGDQRLARASAHVIGPQRGAIDGAREPPAPGYHVQVVRGTCHVDEARVSARRTSRMRRRSPPRCLDRSA